MTHNDEQIDLLMRRFARTGSSTQDRPDHLDADEMNAFAEGVLPPGARTRYVSHLANCDECRKQVTQLAIASGAVARVDQTVQNTPEPRGLWAALTGVFALPALRYVAFAAIAIVVASVGFLALRHRPESPRSLVAAREPLIAQPSAETKSPADTNGALTDKPDNTRASAGSPPAATSASPLGTLSSPQAKQAEDRVAENTTPQPGAMKETVTVTEESEKKAEQMPASQSQVAQAQPQPQYAPAPPGEAQSGGRAQSQTGAAAVGGLKTQPLQSADKASAADRERDVAKDARSDQANQSALALRRGADEKLKSGPSRNADNTAANNRSANEVQARAAEAPNSAPATARKEDAPVTRSAGGHKFRRQGNSWVDQKFKSSMSLKNVSRGSEDYAALDGGLRSIAEQISGEVIVVWKGKAYLIK